MKSKAGLLAFMAMATATNPNAFSSSVDPETLKGAKQIPKKPKIIPKGCKEFEFEGFKCIALNEKSALKKYQTFLKHNLPHDN